MVGFQKFSTTPSYALRRTTQFLAKWNVSWRYIIVVSFISIAFVVAALWIFKCFRRTTKVDFRLLVDGFLDITPPNAVGLFLKFGPVMQCKAKYDMWYCFWYSPENSKKRSQKTNFLAFFQRFFDHAIVRPMVHAPIFFQMKGFMVIHNSGELHQDSICGSKVINFQIFSWRCSSHKIGPFCVFLVPFSPKYNSNLLKLGPEVFHRNRKTLYEQFFKIRCLSANGTYPKFPVLVEFWAQFTPGKQKILPQTKIFPETTSLGLSYDTSLEFQINRRILVKIIKNTHFLGPKWV